MSNSVVRRRGAALLTVIGLSLGTIAASTGAAAAGVVKKDSSVYTLPGFGLVEGASVDARITNGGVNLSIQTNGLTPGNAYTLWSISFSNPEECTDGMEDRLCGPGDSGAGPQGFAMNLVGGHMVGASGQLTISGQVDVDNATGAEYHIVVADHGAMDPSLLPEQIMTPGPGVQIGFLAPEA